MAILICGSEPYLINKQISEYSNIEYSEFNYNKIFSFGPEELELCYQFPLMHDKRIVVYVADSKFDDTYIQKYLQNEVSSTELVLVIPAIDKRKTLYKSLLKAKKVITLDKLATSKACDYIKENMCVDLYIGREAIEYLLLRLDYFDNPEVNLYDIENSIEKLGLYAKGNEINTSEIDLLVEKSLSTNVFALATAILKGKADVAQSLFNDLSQSQAVIGLISLMQSNFKQLYKIQLAKEASIEDIPKALEISPYAFKALSQYDYSATQANACITACNDKIQAIKTGRYNDKLASSILLADLFEILAV